MVSSSNRTNTFKEQGHVHLTFCCIIPLARGSHVVVNIVCDCRVCNPESECITVGGPGVDASFIAYMAITSGGICSMSSAPAATVPCQHDEFGECVSTINMEPYLVKASDPGSSQCLANLSQQRQIKTVRPMQISSVRATFICCNFHMHTATP